MPNTLRLYRHGVFGFVLYILVRMGEGYMILGGMIACIFVSVILSLFSFIIWKKKDLSFVAGYDEQTFSGDPHKLANAVGAFLMTSAVLTLILSFALTFIGTIAGILFATILITGIIGLVTYIKLINK